VLATVSDLLREIEKNPPLSFIHPNAFNGFKKLSVV
jgi:hypothetical protein